MFRDAFAEFFEVGGVGGEQAAEHHRLHFLEAGQRLGGGAFGVGDGVADAGLRDFLDLGCNDADFARRDFGQDFELGPHAADAVDQMLCAGGHELDFLALFDDAIDDSNQDDDAEIGVVPAVDEHGLQRRVAVARWRGDAGDDGLQHLVDADAGFGAGEDGVVGGEADDFLDFGFDLVDLGGGQVDLVDDGDDFMVVLDGLVDIGERLRLYALGCVHHEQCAFARGEAARDFIGEVDMAGGVHQVELVKEPVLRGVIEPHGLRLDGDAAFFLDLHIVEHLPLPRHLAVGEPACLLDQPVGQRRFAMVDMRDNREIADAGKLSHAAPLAGGPREGKCKAAPPIASGY